MDTWQVAQNYVAFAALAGGVGGYYYYTYKQSPAGRRSSTIEKAGARRASIQEQAAASGKQAQKSDGAASRKRKAPKKQQPPQAAQPTPQVVVQDEKPEKESDVNDAQFAQRMNNARQGSKLAAPKGKENRIKTVKQSSAKDTPAMSSDSSQADGETGAEADDEATSPAANSGDVSDMLEPKASGPTSLRVTAPTQPQKERKPKQQKEEVVESKKARQNRKKVEQRQLAREAEEKDRKALEERQRRAAREARGEPAKNGIPIAKAPVNNPWEAKNAATAAAVQTGAPATNGASNGPLLDTFDNESTGSSTGRASTAATSTYESGMNEEAQMAQAVKESEDESGWTQVSVPKKQQKKKGETSGEATPVEKPKVAAPAVKPVPLFTQPAKTAGFAALNADNPEDWEA